MSTVRFRLNHPKEKDGSLKSESCPILVEFYSKIVRLELSTGERAYPVNWSGGRVTSKEKGFKEINTALSRIETEILDIWAAYRDKAPSEIKDRIRAAVKGSSQIVQKKTIEDWIETFIKESKVKDSTKQVYNVTFAHLKNFSGKYNRLLTWENFTLEFYDAFTTYLWDDLKHNDNTVGKTIKTVKTFIREAFERDQHQNLSFQKRQFKVTSADVDEIYLNEEELELFYNVDVPARLIEPKKKFVFDCWVGLRFSDLSKLSPNNVLKTLSGPMLKVTTTKTGEDVVIPFHPIAQEIWDSWRGQPPAQSSPDFNEDIKTIAELAGINTMVQKRNTVKGKTTIEWMPKYKMVKAHTCRRSFATNTYLQGVPKETIMAITGHKTEKSFKKYIRITKETHANIMAEFFKKSTGEAVMKKAN